MRLLALVVLAPVALAGSAQAQTRDESWTRCIGADPDLVITGCTALIESGSGGNDQLASAFHHRGDVWQARGEQDRAIRDYDQAIRLKPDLADAWDSRGKAYAAKGELDRAIRDHDQAMRLNPSHPSAYLNRGMAYFRQRIYHQAMQDSRTALRINPSNVEALRLRALSLARTHQHDLAILDFDRALRLKDSAEIRQLRCDSLKVMGREREC